MAGRRIGYRSLLLVLFLSLLCIGGCKDASPPTATPPSTAAPTTISMPLLQATIRFTDVTLEAGVVFRHEAGATGNKWYPETIGAGGGFVDYDGDGWLDILLVNGRPWPEQRQAPEPTMRLYRNQGDGTFRDVTAPSGLDVPLYGMGMTAADYDNDGDQDVVITGYRETVLFQNNGNGAFTDVRASAGLAQATWSTAAAFVDVDRDGWLDLFVGSYVDWDPGKETGLDCTYGTPDKDYCAVKYFRGQGLRLYRNLGDGTFRDVTDASGVTAPEARVLGLSIVDYNQDGWPDVLVANDLTPSLFFANQGDGTFQEIGAQSGLVLDEGGVAFAGMGIDTASPKNDGQLCVAIGNFAGQPTTLHCQGEADGAAQPEVFIEHSHRAGLAKPTLRMVTFGLFFFDADLNGWQDLFMVNGHVVNEEHLRNVPYAQPPQLFRNQGDGTFAESPPGDKTGLDLRLVGRGAAYADYDQDGDLDLLLTANQGTAHLLRNDTPRRGHFVRLITQGTQSNRDGIGARARLYTSQRQLSNMVRTGSSYLSHNTLALTFGLQPEEQIERVEIHWPSGARDVFHDVQPDTPFVAHEGTAVSKVAAARSLPTAPGSDILTRKRTALADYQAGRFQDALVALQQVYQQHPTDYIVQQYLIELYWRQGEYEPARTLLADMSRTMSEANFLMQFAFHLDAQQLYDLANEVYHTAAQRDPHLAEAPYRLGNNALRAGRYDAAINHFQQARQRHDGFAHAIHGLGLAYAAQGKTAQAETQFQAALRLAPDFAEAYTHLGKLYTRTDRLDQAATAYRALITLQPQQAQGYHNLGTVLAAQGQAEAAMAQYREALRRDPRFLAAHNDLGALHAERGDFPQAIAAFQAALESDATSVQAHYNLALAYGASGDPQAMQRELHATLRLDPQHAEAHVNLGVLTLQQGQIDAAITQFRTATELAPHLADAHYFLAVAYAQHGQAEAMLAPLHETVRLNPQHARAHSTLAALYFERQQYDLAWRHGQQAAQLGAPMQPLLEALQQVAAPPSIENR